MNWLIEHPPMLHVIFAIYIFILLSPIIYYLVNMIYTDSKYLKGKGLYKNERNSEKARRTKL